MIEGYISKLWQAWSNFNRGILLAAIRGGTRSDGFVVTSAYDNLGDLEIAFVASQLGHKNPIGTIRQLSTRKHEPTWAYFEVPNRVLTGISSNIEADLLQSFSAQATLNDLRVCRNSSAHITPESLADVRAAQVRYSFNKFRHPTDMSFWLDQVTADFLWKSWISEMRFISNSIVE